MSSRNILLQNPRLVANEAGEALFRYTGTAQTETIESLSQENAPNYLLNVYKISQFEFTWSVPQGVTSICMVAIGAGGSGEGDNGENSGSGAGGGGLVYLNDYPVFEGQEFKIYVGAPGRELTHSVGGVWGFPSGVFYNDQPIIVAGGGGGGATQTLAGLGAPAYGVSGAVAFSGGNGAQGNATVGGRGGDAAGWYADADDASANDRYGGAGTSPYGENIEGSEWPARRRTEASNGGLGADYGGGGGGANDALPSVTYDGGDGGEGCVRIIWGHGRRFPSNLCDEASSNGNVTKYTVS